ncbi:MAG: carbohydrate kinase family protein [Spartobacteria bacterium]|nr:carbohydrate kinase family protein [Spartobacteria bacterium]
MSRIVIAGLINLETTVRIAGFPLPYYPVAYPFNGVSSTVSGVGYNIARAMQVLGDETHLCALIGHDTDDVTAMIKKEMRRHTMPLDGLLCVLDATPQSVILYDPSGRRQIHVDLKDIQDRRYDAGMVQKQLDGADLAVICNINFSRSLIETARKAGIPVATDVHALSNVQDEYNAEFMRAADILFVSNEHFVGREREMLDALRQAYSCRIIVCGMGAEGALMVETTPTGFRYHHEPAVILRPIVNTVGAGDALFSAFNHYYAQQKHADGALYRACRFASWKIGEAGAAQGFIDSASLDALLD